MKSRNVELFEKSLSAMMAAVEIYNKPNFEYREETYAILALNSWELLLKAKWLLDHSNKTNSLYVFEDMRKKDGTKGNKKIIKVTRGGNPFTHSIDYLASKLVMKGSLDQTVLINLQALTEIRDSAVHFYHKNLAFAKRLQEIGMASVKNYVELSREWFGKDLSGFNFYLMPLAFVQIPDKMEGLIFNKEETNLIAYLESLEKHKTNQHKFDVSISINIAFSKTSALDAFKVQLTKDSTAPKVQWSYEQVRQKWPWDYKELQNQCRKRYSDFKAVQRFHDFRKAVQGDEKYCKTNYLDPGNPRSGKKEFYSTSIIGYLDNYYTKK